MSQPLSAAERRYVKALYRLGERTGRSAITSRMVARHLGVTDPSASAMLQRLADRQLVDYQRYRSSRLTPAGRTCAQAIIRIHRLLETWLYQRLQMPWHRLHREAEYLEPVVSERFVARIAEQLASATLCPYGRPLLFDAANGGAARPRTSIHELAVGSTGRIVEVEDLEPTVLRRLDMLAFRPNRVLTIVRQDAHQTIVSVGDVGSSEPLNADLAQAIFIAPKESHVTSRSIRALGVQ